MAERGEEAKSERRIEAQAREILRTERRILSVADFMALMMVAATLFTAFATWRTYRVSELIFAVADRPFIGVQSVAFERVDTPHPAIVVDLRNFGPIPADDAIVNVTALLEGKPIPPQDGEIPESNQGVVSPQVPHFFYVFMSSDDYTRVVGGAAHLMVRIHVEYKGPALERLYCYMKKVFFDHHTGTFRPAGGTSHCADTDIF